MSEKLQKPIELPVVWDESDVPVYIANMFTLFGAGPDEMFLSFGQVVPPAIPGGSEEERREIMEKAAFVSVRPIGRFAMSERRMRELHDLLSRTIAQLDALHAGEGERS